MKNVNFVILVIFCFGCTKNIEKQKYENNDVELEFTEENIKKQNKQRHEYNELEFTEEGKSGNHIENQQDIYNIINNTTWSIYSINSKPWGEPTWYNDEFNPAFGFYWKAFRFFPDDHRCLIYDDDEFGLGDGFGTWNINKNELELKINGEDYGKDYGIIYSGKYILEFTDERYLTLYHENGNVFKCTRNDIPKIDDMTVFLANGGDTELRGNFNCTLLSDCISYGKINDVEILLEAGADVNAQSIYGQTVLHYAARMSFANIVSKLLSRGADVNAKDVWGQTPLDMASTKSYWDYPGVDKQLTRKILLENGAVYGLLD